MDIAVLMAIFSSLALGHSLFLAVYFWKLGNPSNRLLSLLLLALGIRITKSVIIVLFPYAPDLFPAIGLIGMACIGPLLWLYVRAGLSAQFLPGQNVIWHFVLPAALLLFIPFAGDRLVYHFYQITVAQMGAYGLVSWLTVWQKQVILRNDRDTWHWLILLHAATGLIWFTFLAQLTLESLSTYVAVTVTATLALYGLSLWAMQRQQIFKKSKRQINNGASMDSASKALSVPLDRLFVQEKIFTDPELTLKKLANHLEVPAYLVSKAINAHFEKTFPELLYTLRAREAAKRLQQPEYAHLSIEAISFDSGFNSLSAFYAAFKKLYGTTPANYRSEHLRQSMAS